MSRPENTHAILVVEDEWLIAIDIQTTLENEGYRVIGPARNVATAFDLIENHQVDAAFLDITLGSEKSYPIAEKLNALGVPLTFVSAYTKTERSSKFDKFDLLSKPVMPRLLLSQLQKMLE